MEAAARRGDAAEAATRRGGTPQRQLHAAVEGSVCMLKVAFGQFSFHKIMTPYTKRSCL